MNDNAKKWVATLRSGEFEQVRGSLHDGEGYCCLGVACEVYRNETGLGHWANGVFTIGMFREWLILVPAVRDWLGLADAGGAYEDPSGTALGLAGNNDDGLSFAEIADIIEAEPEGLFATVDAS